MNAHLSGISLQHMLVFTKVVETGGFAKASLVLNMTQSAVSKSIARLEHELELELFTRTTRNLSVTESGEILYQYWYKLLSEIEDNYELACTASLKKDNTLRIGILNSARPSQYFWDLEQAFIIKYPEYSIDLESRYIHALENDLFTGIMDCIMIPDFEHYAIEERNMCWKWAARANAMVYMNATHPLASSEALTTLDILEHPVASLNQANTDGYNRTLSEYFAPYHVKPNIQSVYQNPVEIRYLFQRNNPTILVADQFFDGPEGPEFRKIPLIDQKNGIICAWNPSNQKKPLLKFLQLLDEVAKVE